MLWAATGIGLVSILVGILNTVGSYFAWAKRSEAHRITAAAYGKLHSFIGVELALPREQRMSADAFLSAVRSQTERLAETSPQVPDGAIAAFKSTFRERPPGIAVPTECNGLHRVTIHPVRSLEERLGLTLRVPAKQAEAETAASK